MNTLAPSIDESVDRYLKQVREINPKIRPDLVEKAYRFSWNAHKDQLRKSGEPFVSMRC